MSTQQPSIRRVLLDTASWVGGWVLIFKQAGIVFPPPEQVNETLIWLAATMIGVPGIAQILFARFGGGTSTAELSQRQASPESLPSSSGESSQGGN